MAAAVGVDETSSRKLVTITASALTDRGRRAHAAATQAQPSGARGWGVRASKDDQPTVAIDQKAQSRLTVWGCLFSAQRDGAWLQLQLAARR